MASTATVPAWRYSDFAGTPFEFGGAQKPFAICEADCRLLATLPDGERNLALQYLHSDWQHEMTRRELGSIIVPPRANLWIARDRERKWREHLAAAQDEYRRASAALVECVA